MKYGGWVKLPDDLEPGETESALSLLYRKLWERCPGRPWTYIIRDWWHQYSLLWIFGFLFILLPLGALLGHLFW